MSPTREILESFLLCKYKAYLQYEGNHGKKSEYELMLIESKNQTSAAAKTKILKRFEGDEVQKHVDLTYSFLKKGFPFLLESCLHNEFISLIFDGLKIEEGKSKIGDYHYIPLLFYESYNIRKNQRLLLELYGLFLNEIQGRVPSSGVIYCGRECRIRKTKLFSDPHEAKRLYEEVKQLYKSRFIPTHILNRHCDICEFRQHCHNKALEEDNISLLRGIGEKEVKANRKKGIFTLTQFTYTFRPRRKGKRAEKSKKRYYALQAMAIRDKRVYVFGTPQLSISPVQIYFDIEGIPEEKYVYLIGMIISDGISEKQYSFWADTKDQELKIFYQFLSSVDQYDNFRLFCYGSYEKIFLRRMRKKAKRKKLVDKVSSRLINILSLVYSNFYFPTYTNSLKDIGGYVSCSWADKKASGTQSIVWRMNWEATRDEEWKQKLINYNLEDCVALKKVKQFIYSAGRKNLKTDESNGNVNKVAWINEIDELSSSRRWGKANFFHSDFKNINDCAYFDYQRQRVFIRTSKTIKKNTPKPHLRRNRNLRVTQKIKIESRKCTFCKSDDLTRDVKGTYSNVQRPRVKRAFDLIVTHAGIKRKVIECRSSIHQCQQCGQIFVPDRYNRLDMYFHGLKSWVLYQHIAYRTSFGNLEMMCKEFFGLHIHPNQLHMMKSLMARYYNFTYKKLLKKLLSGPVLHIDETEVTLKKGKGYIWVFTSIEEVVYMYKSTREGGFLKELLKDFRGVLISDFYNAYDSLGCPQQKCLIHLIRDMNQELLNNPFDEELQLLTQPFGMLLRTIVETIDNYGLKRRYLQRHTRGITQYFKLLSTETFYSDAAVDLQKRLIRYKDKLFTFIEYDGIPWNNTCAENAIKRFAYYRAGTKSAMKEDGLNDYLVMLSIFQTCRYKGISFLQFLLSRERDIEFFCEKRRRKRRHASVEIYPKGFTPPYIVSLRRHTLKNDSKKKTVGKPQKM